MKVLRSLFRVRKVVLNSECEVHPSQEVALHGEVDHILLDVVHKSETPHVDGCEVDEAADSDNYEMVALVEGLVESVRVGFPEQVVIHGSQVLLLHI